MEASTDIHLVQTGPEWFEAGLAYRYQMPDGPGPYPTVVMLHGRLGNEDVMWVFRKVFPRPWLAVAPRAPLADHEAFSWHLQTHGMWPELAAYDEAAAALERFIRALPRLYNADPDRIYLMGFSQGAAVAFAMALRRPKMVHGVAGLVGFVPTATEAEVSGRLDGLPVFLATGLEDETVPYEISQKSLALLRSSGADVAYHEYPTGHKLTAAGMADLKKWFNEQR